MTPSKSHPQGLGLQQQQSVNNKLIEVRNEFSKLAKYPSPAIAKLDLQQQQSVNNKSIEVKEEFSKLAKSSSPVMKKVDPEVKREPTPVSTTMQKKEAVSPPATAVTSSGFKIDMSSFQEQLSGLSLGRPSSGLIPQAPPGSDTSWTNFLINRPTNGEESSTLSQTSTEKPLKPYE